MATVVCAVAGGKGGVGRTTSAINLGAALEQYDYDTTVVDGDLSMSNMQLLLGLDVDRGVHSILAGEASVAEASVDLPGGLTVMPGERELDAYGDATTSAFPEIIEAIRGTADVIIVDTSARPGSETSAALEVADVVLLVTTVDEPAVRNTATIRRLTERLDGEVAGALVTRVRDRSDIEQAGELLEVPVVGGIPADDDAVGDEPLMTKALDSDAAKAYGECADRFDSLVLQDVPHEDVELAFEDTWTTAGETAEATAEATDDEPTEADPTAETDDDDDDSQEFTGGALPFG
jgi:septum site-determining protein MinD